MNLKTIIAISCFVLGTAPAIAQDCKSIETLILQANCGSVERNHLCLNGESMDLQKLSDLTIDDVALASLQADYPDADPKQIFSVVFIGPLKVQNEASVSTEPLPTRVPIKVNTPGSRANIRATPTSSGKILSGVADGVLLTGIGRLENSSWLRVLLPDNASQAGWISSRLITSDYDVSLLTISTKEDPVPLYPEYTPMQAFSFIPNSPCAGILLQSGKSPVRLRVNGAQVTFNDSTAFIQSDTTSMTIYALDGFAQAQTDNGILTAIPGSSISGSLVDGKAIFSSEVPRGYDQTVLMPLEGNYFPNNFTIASSASDSDIKTALLMPLSGLWIVEPTMYDFTGPDCATSYSGPLGNPYGNILQITVSSDGSQFSYVDQIGGALVYKRTAPGIYSGKYVDLNVVSPTRLEGYSGGPMGAGINCSVYGHFNLHWIGT